MQQLSQTATRSSRAPSSRAAICAAVVSLAAACGDDAQVPFGLETAPGETATGANPDGLTDPNAPFAPTEGPTFPAGTRSVAIEGAPVESTGDIRALLALDVDGDRDRDVVALEVEGSTARLVFVRREEGAFLAPTPLGGPLEGAEGCEVTGASLATVSPRFALGRVSRSCEGPPAAAPGESATDESFWILSLDGTPRVHEQVVMLPAAGRAPGNVEVTLDVRDRDEDGHRDVVLDVSVTPEGAGPGTSAAEASISWLDRPSGLARDTAEPEASLTALADSALGALGSDRPRALADARRALVLFGALCREAGAPRLRFGTSEGLACGASLGAGRAAAALTTALARDGEVFAALDAYRRLDEDGYRVPPRARRLATNAMDAMATSEGISEWQGPAVTLPPATPARLPALAFLDSTHLLVRGSSTVILDLAALDAPPTVPHQDTNLLLTDPSGQFAATAIERTCDGYVVSIARAAEVVAGVVAGRPVSTPLIAPAAAPSGARCPTLPDDVRRDDGGFRILGWAPQGIVVARRDELRLVPLTVDAAAAGPARTLGPSDPAPAPLLGGAATTDGSAYVLHTPRGLVLHHRGAREGAIRLLRPPEWDGAAVNPLDVVVSPNLDRIAYLAGGRVRTITWATPAGR